MHRNDLYKSLRKTKQDIGRTRAAAHGYTGVPSFVCIADGSKLWDAQSVWFILKMMKIMVLSPDDRYS